MNIPEELGDDIPVIISDPESDEEDVIVCESSTEFSDSERSSITLESDTEYSTTDTESTVGAIVSSTDSDSDSDYPYTRRHQRRLATKQIGRGTVIKPHGSIEKESMYSSAKDSGLGTAASEETVSFAATKSYDGLQGIYNISLHNIM
jgi:hypothetical protein